jgi:hypothetical protein
MATAGKAAVENFILEFEAILCTSREMCSITSFFQNLIKPIV